MSTFLVWNGRKQLHVSNITRDDQGRIQSAYVINGAWELELRAGEMLAKDRYGNIVTRQPAPDFHEVEADD